MIRIVIQNLLLFVLPMVLYALYMAWARNRARAAGALQPTWEEGPGFWLVLGGAALGVGSLVARALLGEYNPEGVYQPARVEDGRIVPGRIK